MYIDVDMMQRRDLQGRLSFTVNGKKVNRVTMAKSGPFGAIEYFVYPFKINRRKNEVVKRKVRGAVKISISPMGSKEIL